MILIKFKEKDKLFISDRDIFSCCCTSYLCNWQNVAITRGTRGTYRASRNCC